MSHTETGSTPRHRLNDLLDMRIRFADGTDGERVTDVRLVPGERVRGQLNELVIEGLIVGRRRPGTLFGYDRNPHQGPWLVRVVIAYLHRHTGYVEWTDVVRVDWDDDTVHLNTNGLRDLQPESTTSDPSPHARRVAITACPNGYDGPSSGVPGRRRAVHGPLEASGRLRASDGYVVPFPILVGVWSSRFLVRHHGRP